MPEDRCGGQKVASQNAVAVLPSRLCSARYRGLFAGMAFQAVLSATRAPGAARSRGGPAAAVTSTARPLPGRSEGRRGASPARPARITAPTASSRRRPREGAGGRRGPVSAAGPPFSPSPEAVPHRTAARAQRHRDLAAGRPRLRRHQAPGRVPGTAEQVRSGPSPCLPWASTRSRPWHARAPRLPKPESSAPAAKPEPARGEPRLRPAPRSPAPGLPLR